MHHFASCKKKLIYSFILFFFFHTIVFAQYLSNSETRVWLNQHLQFDLAKISENVSPNDGLPGAVIAAKTKHDPNYYYHWVRDAGITIDSLIQVYPSLSVDQKKAISTIMFDYLDFSARIQKVNTLSGLGEPKFNVDGTAFNDMWARPQNDGPAMRAISLIDWANILIAEGKESIVKEKLYKAEIPAVSPIKMDLEYVSHHWNDPSYDLWEEVKGTHFYTLMIERRALIQGAKLARYLNDEGAANWYQKQAKAIEDELQNFWDPLKGYFVETPNRVDGLDYKYSNLDVAVILGLLHGGLNDGFLNWDDQRVTSTIEKLIDAFAKLYPINQRKEIPGVAIGRYPEDKYNGYAFTGGNPWPLCTLAIAEALYRYAQVLTNKGEKQKAAEIANYADQFVERVRYHANSDGSLNEQINKNTGYMTSVSDLTWNYAALITARQAVVQ